MQGVCVCGDTEVHGGVFLRSWRRRAGEEGRPGVWCGGQAGVLPQPLQPCSGGMLREASILVLQAPI